MQGFTAQLGPEYVETAKTAPFPSSCPTDMWTTKIRVTSCMNICRDAALYLTINSIYTGAGGGEQRIGTHHKKRVRYPYI